MPKQIQLEVYTFEELLERRNQRAIDKARDWITGDEGGDFSYTIELWEQALEQIGFESASIRCRGFCSQGDGACFTATVDVEKLASFFAKTIQPSESIGYDETTKKEDFRGWLVRKLEGKETEPRYLRIIPMQNYIDHFEVERTSHHYCHENTCRVDAWLNCRDRYHRSRALFKEFAESAEKLRYDLCKCIYHDLDAENDYYQSDQYAKELCEANDWYFYDSGKFYGTMSEAEPLQQVKAVRRVLRAKDLVQ